MTEQKPAEAFPPPHSLLQVSADLLRDLQRLARIATPELLWRNVLTTLVDETQALAAGLRFVVPPRAGSPPAVPLPDVPEILLGELDAASLLWLRTPGLPDGPLSPEARPIAGGRSLRMILEAAGAARLVPLVIDFPSGYELHEEEYGLLAAALRAVAGAAATAGELAATRERLNRFQHLYEVGQAITSSLDLDQVLRQSTARVSEVLSAESSTLLLVDEGRRELVFKIPAGPAEQMLLEQRMPINKGVAGWAVTRGQPVIIQDAQHDERFYGAVDQMTGYQTRSIMAVPLQIKGKTIGVVEVINKLAGGLFSEDDLQWLSILAPLIAVAIDNARLFTQERQRVSELVAANSVAAALNETLELPVMLRSALLTTMNVLHAEAGEIGLLNQASGLLEFQVQEGRDPAVPPGECCTEDSDLARWIMGHRRPLILPDVTQDDRTGRLRTIYPGLRAYAGVPLIGQDRMIGVMSVMARAEGAFDAAQVRLLDTIGRQIGMALENAHLYVALREEHERIVAAEETVRHELARNLHDGPAQIMAALILNIDMARRQLAARPEKMATELNFLESLAQEANQEVRDLLFNLRPLSLEAHGLVAALTQLVERVQHHANYQIHLEVTPLSADAIEARVAGTLFVIVQEALNNIHKHARAANVWVRLGASDNLLWIDVIDDGTGFNVNEVDASYALGNSFGLLNMRERARLIEGTTRIQSPRPGYADGTLVHVEVPLTRAAPLK